METTAVVIIIIAAGIFAFAAWGVVTLEKYEKDYRELDAFIDECENTAENFDIAKNEAIKLIHSKFIAERDCQSLRKKIYNKFLLL
jgi:hypothetical protein